MSKPIPPSPNAIIAALLEIGSSAFNVVHCAEQRMVGDGSGQREHYIEDNKAFESLEKSVAALDPLVALFVGSQMNPPDCARELLQSFLVGGSTLTVAAVDVQRDGMEFKEHTWNAPATGPGFTPTSEFPASGPIHHDFYTHRDSWRKAIQHCIDTSAMPTPESDDAEYWRHELRAFDRAFGMLPPEFPASLKERANVVAPQMDRRMRPRLVEPDFRSLQEQSNAWDAVCKALDAAMPGWSTATPRGKTSAVIAIEKLAARAAEPNREQIRTNMLADTADEALRIINDAGLLKNLVELFTIEPFADISIREVKGGPWQIYVDPADEDTKPRCYTSTSMEQAIVVAHKGESDRLYPEPKP